MMGTVRLASCAAASPGVPSATIRSGASPINSAAYARWRLASSASDDLSGDYHLLAIPVDVVALNRDSSDEPEFDVDSSEFPGCSEVPPAFVAVRRQSGSGAAFLGRNCLFFLGIWARSSRRLLLNA